MNPMSLFPFNDTACQAGDWTLVILIVTVLVQFLVMGPEQESYRRGLSSMYRFNSPDGNVHFPVLSHFVSAVSVLASCSASALLLVCIMPAEGPDDLARILSFSVLVLAFFLFRLALYSFVNSKLYRKQTITVKPVRWNGFFIMVFTFCGLLSSLFAAVSMFFVLPPAVPLAAIAAAVAVLEIGCIFKIKTSLLKNRCTFLGFFVYLCALEIGPLAALWFVLAK